MATLEFEPPTLLSTDIEALITRLQELNLKYRSNYGSVFGWAASEIISWRESSRRWQALAASQSPTPPGESGMRDKTIEELTALWKKYRDASTTAPGYSDMERMAFGGRAGGILEALDLLRALSQSSKPPPPAVPSACPHGVSSKEFCHTCTPYVRPDQTVEGTLQPEE